jgi:tetratricopeptide (TPR) repeat protein
MMNEGKQVDSKPDLSLLLSSYCTKHQLTIPSYPSEALKEFSELFPVPFTCDGCHQKCSVPKQCSGCLTVYYCSSGCQKLHWKEHKSSCLYFAKASKEFISFKEESVDSDKQFDVTSLNSCCICHIILPPVTPAKDHEVEELDQLENKGKNSVLTSPPSPISSLSSGILLSCQHLFCFTCLHDYYRECNISLLRDGKLLGDDRETEMTIDHNSKGCPICRCSSLEDNDDGSDLSSALYRYAFSNFQYFSKKAFRLQSCCESSFSNISTDSKLSLSFSLCTHYTKLARQEYNRYRSLISFIPVEFFDSASWDINELALLVLEKNYDEVISIAYRLLTSDISQLKESYKNYLMVCEYLLEGYYQKGCYSDCCKVALKTLQELKDALKNEEIQELEEKEKKKKKSSQTNAFLSTTKVVNSHKSLKKITESNQIVENENVHNNEPKQAIDSQPVSQADSTNEKEKIKPYYHSNKTKLWRYLSFSYYSLGNYSKAEKYGKYILKEHHWMKGIYSHVMKCLKAQGKWKESIEIMKVAIRYETPYDMNNRISLYYEYYDLLKERHISLMNEYPDLEMKDSKRILQVIDEPDKYERK